MSNQSNLPPEVREIWTDGYKLHATFAGMGNTADEWIRCADTVTGLVKKHRQHPLALALFLTVYEYLSDERKPAAYQEAMERAMLSG